MDSGHERLLTVLLTAAIVISVIGVVYFATTTQSTSVEYTEFYILDSNGGTENYPTTLSVGETGNIIVGLINNEGEQTTYTIEILLGERSVMSQEVTVDSSETWERRFSFTPQSPGRVKLRILLYKGETPDSDSNPYRDLRLWIEVNERT